MQSHVLSRRVALCLGVLLLAGCSAQDLARLRQDQAQAAASLAEAQTVRSRIEQTLSTRPADDPLREQIAPQLAKLDGAVGRLQASLPLLDAAIKSAGAGQLDPSVQQAVAAIPYGSLGLAAFALVFGAVKHVQAGTLTSRCEQAQKAFDQIVSALDAALPSPTAEQKIKIEAALDTDVKSKLAVARTG